MWLTLSMVHPHISYHHYIYMSHNCISRLSLPKFRVIWHVRMCAIEKKAELIAYGNSFCSRMVARGGGVTAIEAVIVTPSTQTRVPLPSLPISGLPASLSLSSITTINDEDSKRVPYIVVHIHVRYQHSIAQSMIHSVILCIC
jgi:hypothetical protein